MSAMANTTPLVTTVTKPTTNPRETDTTPRVNIQKFCEEYYDDILPIIMDKVRQDRRKDVHTSLDFGEGYRRQSAFDRISETYSPSTTKSHPQEADSRDTLRGRNITHGLNTSREDRLKNRERFRSIRESFDDSFSHSRCDGNHPRRRKRGDTKSPSSSASRSDSSDGKYRRTRMPNNVKTYDGTGDPEDHVKVIQAASQVERWAMPTWCHMFNLTLIGAAKVWFDELPPESIDSYRDLKVAFLAYFMQQKKYVKDPVEIHNIKQREGETIGDFMERFKVETGRMKGAPECMRIFGFMHGVNNPELTKSLNEHVPKTMEEMMITTTAFIRGEAVAASKKIGHVSWKAHDQSKRQNSDKRFDFRGHSREGRGSNRFTPLTRTPKEILAAEASKFQPPPPMVTSVEKRSNNKLYDFHNDNGHIIDECMQLKKQIEELVRAGKLLHLIKEIKQGRDQSKTGKNETVVKDKPATIYIVQSNGAEGPLVIEAEMGGHMIHRMYMDGGSSMEILYEHCFNRLRPEIKSQMIPTTTSLTGFSGETIWPLGQLRLLVIIGDTTHSTRTWMNFMIVKSLSPYNGIIGRPGIRAIQVVPSTVHGMLKFPVEGGIVTICSTMLIPTECASVITSPVVPTEERTRPANFKVTLHPEFPDQEVAIGGTLFDKGRTELGTPTQHSRRILTGSAKKRGQAPERAKAIQAEVQKLVEAEIMKEVYYHDWLSNPVMVKKHDGSWRMCVDFIDPNKACPQDCYPLPEIDWKVESLCGYPFKCFLDAYKGYHQIQLAKPDKEKTAFYTGQGKELIIYLSVTYGAISAVLMTKRGTTQMPIYFISRALQGPELNYSPMEKLVLSLVFAAKRLRRYFQAHPITVVTDQPIKQVMSRPDVAGRLQKWSIMLGEHNITYRPRTSTFFTDGSSCVDGSGARLILTSPDGVEFTYALRFQFTASNNEAEYEALIAGLRIAARMGMKDVHVRVDSKLVVNQVLGTYAAKEHNMVKYLEIAKSLVSGFTTFSISQVPWSKNKKADALSKIASTSFAHLSKQVLVEVLKDKSIKEKEVATVIEEDGPTWMTQLVDYLKRGILPGDKNEARKLRLKARQYELLERVLYRRSFLTPWLRCVGPFQAEYVMREIHEGSCSMHVGQRDCQIHLPITRHPQQPLTPITAPWPFYKWGIDIADPFSKGPRKVKFLIVVMDYFTKWIEAKAVATITGGQVKKFVWDNIVCRFGIPGEIVSDNGKQFSENPFKDWCDKLNITQQFASVKHPQSNGLVEIANQTVDVVRNDAELRLNLDLLEERREHAAICEAMAKSKNTKYYNARVRGVTFKPGDFVYRINDASHAVAGEKLGPKWEGHYEVTEALRNGAYKLQSMDGTILPRT
nr:reverse transcriptase domain-containing protein [Tanacetum cinerariifolium]